MKALLFFLLLIICIQSSAQEWELVYHNDENGNAVEGKIEDLIQAVRKGKDMRIAWWFQHPLEKKIKVEHLADASFMTIMSDSIVFGQISPIYGQLPDFDKEEIILKENLEWVMIGGSNGKLDAMTRNMTSGEIIGHNARKSSFKWYVKRK